jgi:hypothetical protein
MLAALLVACSAALPFGPALALSEIQGPETPGTTAPAAPGDTIEQEPLPPVDQVPLPDATTPAAPDQPASPAGPGDTQPGDEAPEEAEPGDDPNAPLPEVIYDLGRLPEPVKRLHDQIIEACKSGDIEKLRPLIETGENGTQLSFGSVDGDPIAYLKEQSGDKEGAEILAILEEVLSAGYVHMDAGTPNEMFIWPYFFAVPLDRLTPAQKVELFKIVTAGDYEDMKTFGSYIFYRVGITAEGRLSFFVAGD